MNVELPLVENPSYRVDKRRISKAFGRAASTYDSAATLQQRVAANLRLQLPELAIDSQILDMGCGTGTETLVLHRRFPSARLIGLDLSNGMLAFARQRQAAFGCCWVAGDIEALPFQKREFDLVFSNLAIQWCESLAQVLAQVERILKPGGWLVFSTLGHNSLHELETAWRAVDNKNHVNRYESFTCQAQHIARSTLLPHVLFQHTETLYYPTVLDLLRELKSLGANTVVEGEGVGLSGRTTLGLLTEGYRPFASERGYPASYQVIYGVLRKLQAR